MLKRTDIRGARIKLHACDKAPAWRFDVNDVRLLLFQPGIAIASVTLSNPEGPQPFHLADGLDFLDYARRVYPPFWDTENTPEPRLVAQSFEWLNADGQSFGDPSDFQCISTYLNHVRQNRTAPAAAHWKWFLDPLLPDPGREARKHISQDSLWFAQLEDDRLPLLAWVAVDDPARISRGDWFRLGFCDDHGDSSDYSCSGAFLEQSSGGIFYDRFWSPPKYTTRYACSGYAFLAVGKASDSNFTVHIRNHMARHYYLLAVLAHLQKASLLYFWQLLSEVVHCFACAPAGEKSRKDLLESQRWLLQDLTDFVSRFYFIEVSSQVQAIELFALWRRGLGIEQLYNEVRDQMEFVARVVETDYQGRLAEAQREIAEQQHKLARAANLLLPPTVAATVTAAFFTVPAVAKALECWSATYFKAVPWALALGTGVAIFVIAYFVSWSLIRNRFRRS